MLTQLIYTSRPFGWDPATLDDILVSARRQNRRNGITGALVVRSDLFIQLLEGERERVTATFGRIVADDRHTNVALGWVGDTAERLFPDWEMLDDPARSWVWTREQVRDGAPKAATMQELRSIFARLRGALQDA